MTFPDYKYMHDFLFCSVKYVIMIMRV